MAATSRTSTRRGPRAADAEEHPGLEHAQQLHLAVGLHLADLVEEERAAVGQLDEPGLGADRAGERALLVAEQLGLEHLARQGAAVDRHEGPLGARRALVDGARHQLLAGAALAEDQHRRVGRRHPLHDAQHLAASAGSRSRCRRRAPAPGRGRAGRRCRAGAGPSRPPCAPGCPAPRSWWAWSGSRRRRASSPPPRWTLPGSRSSRSPAGAPGTPASSRSTSMPSFCGIFMSSTTTSYGSSRSARARPRRRPRPSTSCPRRDSSRTISSRRFFSSSATRTRIGRRHAGSTTRKMLPLPTTRVHLDASAVIGHDALGDREPEAGPLPGRLGGEEGIEDAGERSPRGSRVPRPRTRSRPRAAPARERMVSVPRPSMASSAFDAEPEEHLAQLPLVQRHRRQRGVELGREPAGGEARLVRQELDRLRPDRVEVGRRPPAARARARTAAGCR